MKTICCYCKKDLGEKAPYDDKSVSHGICQSCVNKENAKLCEVGSEEDGCNPGG